MNHTPVILFLGKSGEELTARAAAHVTQFFPQSTVYLGKRGDAFPALEPTASFDVVLSYLCPWVVPASVLQSAKQAAINFHSGPPEYPGIGCTNFAIYDGVREYGVTCHHMANRVDTGRIIKVIRFPLYEEDSVQTLTQRCYAHIASLFYEVMDSLIAGRPLPTSSETWKRKPYRRADLDALCRLTRDMSSEEVQRRIRATTYPGHPAAECVE